MNLKKAFLLMGAVAGAASLSGCLTTQEMPDGSTKIRFSDETSGALSSMIPAGVVTAAGGGGAGGLDLNPTISPLGTGEWLYLNGRFDFECASALLYSAKSGAPMDAQTSNTCRDRYFLRQQQLKRAGKTYDRGAPEYNPSNPPAAYWQSVSGSMISQLASMSQFKARFEGLPRIDKAGNITIKVGFVGAVKGQQVSLLTVPERTPVVISDAAFEYGMRTRSAQMNTDIGEMSACDATLAVTNAVDKGPRPARIPASEYSRYEVRFNVASMGCKNSLHEFKGAGPQSTANR